MSDVYQFKYSQRIKVNNDWVADTQILYTDSNIYELNPFNAQWGNNGCYCGAVANNNSILGTRTIVNWTGWKNDRVNSDMKNCQITSSPYLNQQNLRFVVKYFNESQIIKRQTFKWTGFRDTTKTAIEDGLNNLSQVNLYDPYRRNTKNLSSNGNSNSPLIVAPLNNLKINDLVFLPKFIFRTVKYLNKNEYGYTTVQYSTSAETKYWYQIKPEDKTEQGVEYNSDLYTKGYVETSTPQDDFLEFKYCCGVILLPYYGKSSRIYDGETYIESVNPDDFKEYGYREIFGTVNSDSGYYPDILGTYYRPCLFILTETYDENTDSIIYSTPNGISFTNTSGNNLLTNDYAVQPSWSMDSNFQLFTGTGYWSTYFTTTNNLYSNVYKDQDPTADVLESPNLTVLSTKLDKNIDLSGTTVVGYPTSTIFYTDDTPCAYSYAKQQRSLNPTNVSYFSIEELWHTIASLGCYVADDVLHAQCAMTGKYIGENNHIYLGKMDSNGVTDGTMLQGSDISDSTQSNIDDIIDGTPYVPVNPKQDDDESDPDRDDINPPSREGDNIPIHLNNRFGLFDSFLTMYNLTESQLSNFGSTLLGNPLNYRGNFQKDLSQELSGTYDVSSILNYIVSVKMYPFSVATLPNTSVQATSKIYMGTGEFGIPIGTPCRKLTSSISVLNAGSLNVAPLTPYKDFRDYYNTNIVCYMPYCGCVELNPMDIMNTTLQCYYLIDFLTGDCTALLYSIGSNGLNYPVAIANGNIGIDIPLSATNTGQLEAVKRMQNAQTAHTVISFINTGLQTLDDGISLAKGINEKSLDLTVNSSLNLSRDITSIIDTAFQNEANPFGANRSARSAVAMPLMPAGSGANNFMLNDSVYLQIRRGTYSKPKNYARTMGYPTTYSKQLREVHGLTFCSGVNVSGINCTQEEKKMIRTALEGGTILP